MSDDDFRPADPSETWEVRLPDALEPDWYPAQLTIVSVPKSGTFGPYRDWSWRIPSDGHEGGWYVLTHRVPDQLSPTSNAGKYAAALLGMGSLPAGHSFSLGDLLNRWCRLKLIRNEKGYNKVEDAAVGSPPSGLATTTAQPASPAESTEPDPDYAAFLAYKAAMAEQAAEAAG